MRNGLLIALLAGVTFGQGDDAGTNKKRDLEKQGFAGPGYIQKEFLGDLKESLAEQLGASRAQKCYENLTQCDLSGGEVLALLNDFATKSQLEKWFGVSRANVEDCKAALDEAAYEKNRSLYFGILIVVLVLEMDVDPTSDFCQQVAAARDEGTREDFLKLLRGVVSTDLLEKVFGLTDGGDLSFLQKAINQMQSNPCCRHPMALSLGMGKKEKFDPSKFPPLVEGMRGFGGDFADGVVEGIAFPADLPPCAFVDSSAAGAPAGGSKSGEGGGDGAK